MQGHLSPPHTTYPAFPDSTLPLTLSSPPDFSLPAFTTASPQSGFVSSLPAPHPQLDPHTPMLQDLGSVSAMRFAQAQPLPASPNHHWLPSHASVNSIGPLTSGRAVGRAVVGRAVVDRAVRHCNGLHGHYASPHQQQPQPSSFNLAEWSYPAGDRAAAAAAAAAAYNGEEISCNARDNLVSQQQTAGYLYGGCAAQPSPSTRCLARGKRETRLAQPECEKRARIWDVQLEELGGSQVPELGPDWGLDDAIADIGGDEALADEVIAEHDHAGSARYIQRASGAAESGSACLFAAVHHAAIPVSLPADTRTQCMIHGIVCMSHQGCLPAQQIKHACTCKRRLVVALLHCR